MESPRGCPGRSGGSQRLPFVHPTFDGSRIQMASPALFLPVFMSKDELFPRLVSDAICEPMLAAVLQQKPIKPQWQPLADNFNRLLLADVIYA